MRSRQRIWRDAAGPRGLSLALVALSRMLVGRPIAWCGWQEHPAWACAGLPYRKCECVHYSRVVCRRQAWVQSVVQRGYGDGRKTCAVIRLTPPGRRVANDEGSHTGHRVANLGQSASGCGWTV